LAERVVGICSEVSILTAAHEVLRHVRRRPTLQSYSVFPHDLPSSRVFAVLRVISGLVYYTEASMYVTLPLQCRLKGIDVITGINWTMSCWMPKERSFARLRLASSSGSKLQCITAASTTAHILSRPLGHAYAETRQYFLGAFSSRTLARTVVPEIAQSAASRVWT
jgi:hypothetical protein